MDNWNRRIELPAITSFAGAHTAYDFDKFCGVNLIVVSPIEVNTDNPNEGRYLVQLPDYNAEVLYIDGVFQSVSKI